MSAARDLPVGVFDSGVGGLTVLHEIRARLPRESMIYFGDTARVPYGPKGSATVEEYSREAAAFLLERGIKALVVACNTATAYAADALAAALPVPVIGVIEPGARAAAASTRSGRIGVIGTSGTIASGAYDLAVRRLVGERARVYAQACPLFVPLVEEGLTDHPATRLIAREYLMPLHQLDVDVLVLGCTHYPLLRSLIGEIMPGVTLVDSGAETAAELERTLSSAGLLREGGSAEYRFFSSDSPLRFRELARRFVGDIVEEVGRVNVEGYAPAA